MVTGYSLIAPSCVIYCYQEWFLTPFQNLVPSTANSDNGLARSQRCAPLLLGYVKILRDVGAEINIKILHELEKYVWKKSLPNITLLQFLRQILRFGGGSKAS